jgi:hypothetical protein
MANIARTQDPEPKFAVLAALDFEPEDRPAKMIEATFLVDESTNWLAGLYEVRFVRALSAQEWSARSYRDAIAEAAKATGQ